MNLILKENLDPLKSTGSSLCSTKRDEIFDNNVDQNILDKKNKLLDRIDENHQIPEIKLRNSNIKLNENSQLDISSINNDINSQLNNISILNLSEFVNNLNNKAPDKSNIMTSKDDQYVLLSINEARKLMENTNTSINSFKNELKNTFDSTRISNITDSPKTNMCDDINNIKSPNFGD